MLPLVLRLAVIVVPVAVMFTGLGPAAPRPVQPGYDVAPQVSPNGAWLLFQRLYGGSRYSAPDTTLHIARADGTAERELVGRRIWGSLNALWTADNLVEVILSQQDGTLLTTLRRPEDGAVVRQLPVAATAWSPDGNWIAYVDDRDLYVARPDGSNARLLGTAPGLGTIGTGEFSPDSTRLTYAVHPSTGPARSEVVRIDGTGRVVLKEALVVSPGEWSRDGNAVVLMAQGDPGRPNRYDPPRAYVIGADGSNPHRIAPGFSADPDWSPLGDWIAYDRQTATPTKDLHDVMIVRPNGTDRRRVVRTGGGGATWLADGRHLLAVGSGACRRSGILQIHAFARTVKRLTNRCRIDGTPGADDLRGTPLRDLIDGRGGADRIVGAGGNDRISGGPGGDTISSKDRYRDVVACGPGSDSVSADYRDRVARDCERVRRGAR
jgi:RTX calcium-binding nonapeptide repeat (4 copies)/WD40-like Beta Propeller Repeat